MKQFVDIPLKINSNYIHHIILNNPSTHTHIIYLTIRVKKLALCLLIITVQSSAFIRSPGGHTATSSHKFSLPFALPPTNFADTWKAVLTPLEEKKERNKQNLHPLLWLYMFLHPRLSTGCYTLLWRDGL